MSMALEYYFVNQRNNGAALVLNGDGGMVEALADRQNIPFIIRWHGVIAVVDLMFDVGYSVS